MRSLTSRISSRLVAVLAAAALVAAVIPGAASASDNIARAATIGGGTEYQLAKQFGGLTVLGTATCADWVVANAALAVVFPVRVAVGVAAAGGMLGIDPMYILRHGATQPCSVMMQAARTSAALYAAAVRGRTMTVLLRVDRVNQRGWDACRARFAMATSSGSAVPFDVTYWRPWSGCTAGLRI